MRKVTMTCALVCALAGPVLAQTETKMPKPGPEHKRLAYFVGQWTSSGDMKQTPFAPAGKYTTRDRTELMSGGFFVVTHSSGDSPMGPVQELAIMGFNPEQKVYTYDAYNNMGRHESATGTYDNGTWTWTNEEKFQGQTVKGKFVIKEASPKEYTFTYAVSTDGSTWNPVMEGKSTKTK